MGKQVFRDARGRFTKPVLDVKLHVNADAVIEAAEFLGDMGPRLRSKALARAETIAREAIEGVISRAAIYADVSGGFPPEFQDHLMEAAARMTPVIFFEGNQIYIEVDLEKDLGSYEELTRAFHQGAVLADGKTKLDGPYTGQALLTEDDATRHEFWEAIRYGAATYTTFDKRRGKEVVRPIKDAAAKWERTKQKYIDIWGNKAPEWLFIQFGQPEWEPKVPSMDIVGQIRDQINYNMSEELFYLVQAEVDEANTFKTTGVDTGYNKSGRLIITRGSIEFNGKMYHKGSYVPKGLVI